MPQERPLVEVTLVGACQKAPLPTVARGSVAFLDEVVLLVDDGVVRQYPQGLDPCPVHGFVLFAR